MTYSIIPAEQDHLVYVAERMRREDVEEVAAASGLSPLVAMRHSYEFSSECYTGMAGDEPFCVFGVVPRSLVSSVGVPWLLGTDSLPSHSTGFLKRNRKVVREWREKFALLENYVDCRNTKSIAWIRWLGFVLEEPQPYGRLGLPFMHFYMEGHHV
jgi:hypothetical protein